MRKSIIYTGILTLAAVISTACSNLDESAFHITPTDGNTIYSETFASGLGGFIQKSDSGAQTWGGNSSGYAIMTGYVSSVNNANVDWLISPEIDLTNVTTAKLSFDHVARYFADVSNEATVWISEGYKNDSLTSSVVWTQLKTESFSDPGGWTFNTSGEISLTAYAGKKVRIAFKYISSSAKAGTWEVKNFLVEKGEATVNAELIYSNSFAYSLGDFTAQSVTGAQVWTYNSGYTCANVSGYTSSNNANEDWLISPEIDLTSIENAYLSFDHAGKFFGTPANEATVWVSQDYVSGLPSTGTWTQLNILNYFNNTAYTFVNTGNLNLSSYAGKKIRIALKYTSTTATAGNWEVRNFHVYKGMASGIDTNPFTISEAISFQSGGNAWIQGYVVGYVWPFISQYAYYYTPDSCTQRTNIILADSLTNLYSSKCLSVQLPRGSIRNLLNLTDNKSRYGTKVKLYGVLSSSMGIAGLINPSKFILPDTSGTSVIKNKFSEPFSASLGSFTQTSVSGAQIWVFSSGYGAKMSGYTSVNNANEDWLISPAIDLTTLQSAALSFDHTINKGIVANMKTEQTLWVSTDNGTNWTKLTIPTYPAGTTWTYVNSGEINLDAYAGKTIKIAFKYTCTTSSSATWEIKNFLIYY